MAVEVRHSQVIDRSVDIVFQFMVDDHVRNHPRWDSDIELWMETNDPIQVGTIIRRRNKRSGTPVEGTMEVVEFERNKIFSTITHDGPAKIAGKIEFEALVDDRTRVTMIIDFPEMADSMDTGFIRGRLKETADIRKQLIETEL